MARSEIITQLPLDDWATILGVNPLSFNQLASNNLFQNNTCGEVFFSQSWQHADRVGRDDIAQAIREAEDEIEREVGFHLTPQWTIDERMPYPRPGQPGVFNTWGTNPQGMFKSVEATRGYIISGGIRSKTLVLAGAVIVRSDVDSDGFQETCTIIVPVTFTDVNEVHVYYPATSGSDAWEIRPLTVSISGGNATIQFKVWQVAAANQQNDLKAVVLDADNVNSYETAVDVYRVYNDPSTQVQFLWENGPFGDLSVPGCCGTCYACQFGTQTGCFHLRDPRLGILVPGPGTWDATNQVFNAAQWSACREPDQVRLWYYSGYMDQHVARPEVEMSPYWRTAVAYYAASKLDRPVCGCNNLAEFINRFRLDMMFHDPDKGGFNVTPEFAANRLGTSVGAFYAWRRINQNGVKINK